MKFLHHIENELGICFLGTDEVSEFLRMSDCYSKQKGIRHIFSSPGFPKQNPFVERVIQIIINKGKEVSIPDQQVTLDTYKVICNTIRLHQSLNYMTPRGKVC